MSATLLDSTLPMTSPAADTSAGTRWAGRILTGVGLSLRDARVRALLHPSR